MLRRGIHKIAETTRQSSFLSYKIPNINTAGFYNQPNRISRGFRFTSSSSRGFETGEEKALKNFLVEEGKEKVVGYWLLTCSAAVLCMISLGGYTRLSRSGLSMTKWRFTGYKYPRTQEEWEEEFEDYKVPIMAYKFIEIPRVSACRGGDYNGEI